MNVIVEFVKQICIDESDFSMESVVVDLPFLPHRGDFLGKSIYELRGFFKKIYDYYASLEKIDTSALQFNYVQGVEYSTGVPKIYVGLNTNCFIAMVKCKSKIASGNTGKNAGLSDRYDTFLLPLQVLPHVGDFILNERMRVTGVLHKGGAFVEIFVEDVGN